MKKRKKIQPKKKEEKLHIAQFSIGITLCLFAAVLMVTNLMTISIRIAITIVGILLIATSPFTPLKI